MTFHWHTEPLLVFGVVFAGWIYWIAVFSMRHRLAPETPAAPARAVLFYLGLAAVYIAVGSPIDAIGERYLFWVHMLQHLLLMYLAPIALALGFSRDWIVRFGEQQPVAARIIHRLTQPAVNAALLILIFTAWHVPALYEAALRNKVIHITEHLTLFLPSLAIALRLVGPNEGFTRLPWAGRMLLVFALMVGQIPVFAFLAFTSDPLYPTYIYAPRITGISPMEDQVLGAVLMKVGGMLFALPLLGLSFYRWYLEENQ